MHDSLQSAKERSELLREKGSVFTIRELPSLAFRSSVGLLLVTEINTTTPLSSWIRRCREERSSYHLNQNVCGLEQISTRHTMLTDFARALDNSDMFPDLIPARSKNLFVLAGANPDALHENRRRRLKEWHSYSDGAQFYLGWLEDYADMSGRAVRRVADAISSGLNSSRLN
jgi:hypothetical protein